MCGRFTLILEPDAIQQEFDLGRVPAELTPRYNVAPTQPVAVVRSAESRDVELLRWGLIPSWAKDMDIGNRLINARSETLLEKPSFRNAFAKRRCLILADGFYEWYRPGGKKTGRGVPPPVPYYFQLGDRKPFAFAGLWERWNSPDNTPIESCTIITCAANDLVGRYHERMPVVLDKEHMWEWLDEQAKIPALQMMLTPYPASLMVANEVQPLVNSPALDSPDLIEPAR
jgi:putative SOS response-associated peptidase YedK